MASAISSYNQNSITTSAEKVVSPYQKNIVSILLKAHPDNDGVIYIGTDSSVSSSNGWPLEAGDILVFPCRDTNSCYAIAGSGTQILAYLVEKL